MSRFSLGTRPSVPDPRTTAAVPTIAASVTDRPSSSAAAEPTVLSAWRTSPARLARLVVGLWIFGTGDALIVRSDLGNSPWTVFAEGVSIPTPLSIGVASILIGFVLLLIWIPLRTRLGLGTLLNIVVIGIAIDATLLLVPEVAPVAGRIGLLLTGLALIGLGSGLYLGTAHGPGPRDGLMTGLHARTGLPVGVVRGGIELTALTVGWFLGGTFGVGTVAFALLIGPAVQVGIALVRRVREQGLRRPERISAPSC